MDYFFRRLVRRWLEVSALAETAPIFTLPVDSAFATLPDVRFDLPVLLSASG